MTKPKLHQLQLHGFYGMSYVIQCGDGQLVVIDGGMPYEAQPLYEYLQQLSGKAIPEVSAWIITHLHIDHDGALLEIRKCHAEDLVIQDVICCYPYEEMIREKEPACLSELEGMKDLIQVFGCRHIVPVTGDRYTYGNVEFEVLFTCAEFAPQRRDYNMNDTSTVFRMTVEGQSILFLGDSEPRANEILLGRHGAYLKSDAVQLSHHGGPGSTSRLYSLVDARFVLWPNDVESAVIWLYWLEPNRTVYASDKVEDTFIAGYGTRVLDLPLHGDYAPYVMEKPALHRELTTRFTLPYTSLLPDVQDPSDPAWEQGVTMNVCGNFEGRRRGSHGSLRAFWSEEALYIKLDLFRSPFISNPRSYDKEGCNNVRIHLLEQPVSDMTKRWTHSVEEGSLQGLVLYPEEKTLPGGPAYNSDPTHFSSCGKVEDGHGVICARIPFAKPHHQGDLIGFHTEVNLIWEEGGVRDLRMYLDPDSVFPYYRSLPASVMLWKLI